MDGKSNESNLVEDPVCGMLIAPESATGTSTFEGKQVHFCSSSCKERFDEAPESFVAVEAEHCDHACCS